MSAQGRKRAERTLKVGCRSGVPRATAPEWLRDADRLLVHADDTVTPAYNNSDL
jgi:hypothetical protein